MLPLKIVSVLLSALVKRISVSRMRDFFVQSEEKNLSQIPPQELEVSPLRNNLIRDGI